MRIMNGSAALTPTLPFATRLQLGLLCLGRHAAESGPQSLPCWLGGGTIGGKERVSSLTRFEEVETMGKTDRKTN